MKRVWAATMTGCVAGLLALAPPVFGQTPDVPQIGGSVEDYGQWRSPYFFYRMDRSTQMEMPSLDVAAAIADSQRALLVVNFYYDGGRYSNYQQALLRRILFYLSSKVPKLEVRLLDVMVASSDGRAIYDKELFKYYAGNTLGQYGATIQGTPVMPYGQVYLGGKLIYDFSVMWEARDDNQVMENARAIQSSMLRIATEANAVELPPEEPEKPDVREPDLPPELPAERLVGAPEVPSRPAPAPQTPQAPVMHEQPLPAAPPVAARPAAEPVMQEQPLPAPKAVEAETQARAPAAPPSTADAETLARARTKYLEDHPPVQEAAEPAEPAAPPLTVSEPPSPEPPTAPTAEAPQPAPAAEPASPAPVPLPPDELARARAKYLQNNPPVPAETTSPETAPAEPEATAPAPASEPEPAPVEQPQPIAPEAAAPPADTSARTLPAPQNDELQRARSRWIQELPTPASQPAEPAARAEPAPVETPSAATPQPAQDARPDPVPATEPSAPNPAATPTQQTPAPAAAPQIKLPMIQPESLRPRPLPAVPAATVPAAQAEPAEPTAVQDQSVLTPVDEEPEMPDAEAVTAPEALPADQIGQ